MDTTHATPTAPLPAPRSGSRSDLVRQRTLLLSPKPLGLGTPQAESPSSYFTRVAALNDLTTLQLIFGTKSAPLTLTSPELKALRQSGLACFHRRAVATSAAGCKFVDALATIVGRPELNRLHWGASFPDFSLARMSRDCDVWCSECLRSDAEPYGRLAWESPLITHCSIHHCRLETSCRSCHRTVRWAGATDIVHCRHCGFDRREAGPSREDAPVECSVAAQFGELVAHATSSQDDFRCAAPACVSALREFALRSGHVGLYEEAAFLRLDKVSMWKWEHGKSAPAVSRIVEIAFALGQSPVDVLRGIIPAKAPQGSSAKPLENTRRWSCARLTAGQRDDLIRRLADLARAFPSMGPLRAARKLGVEPVTLNQLAPAKCAEMAASRKRTLVRLRKARLAWFVGRVDRYVAETVSRDGRPTWRGVMGQFRRGTIILDPAYARLVKQALRRVA